MISNKTSIWVFVSGFWAFCWLVVALEPGDTISLTRKFVAFGPLVLGWGIWWLRN